MVNDEGEADYELSLEASIKNSLGFTDSKVGA